MAPLQRPAARPVPSPSLLVLPVRIELTTSPLPRGCSTTELRQRWSGDGCANHGRKRRDPCHKGGGGASADAVTLRCEPRLAREPRRTTALSECGAILRGPA